MDKNNKLLVVLLLALFLISSGFTFFQTVIQKDFEIVAIEPTVEEE